MARKRNVVTPDKLDHDALVAALESQGNAIPAAIATVLRLAAPIIARIAIRYVARVARRKISDRAVNVASAFIGRTIQGIIDRAMEEEKQKENSD